MPEHKKLTLCQQLEAEIQSILATHPDLKLVKLADGAKDNWRFLSNLDLGLPQALATCIEQVEIVDFFHAAEHLKIACDAIWHNDKIKSKAEFERLRTLLKEHKNGVEKSEVPRQAHQKETQKTHLRAVDLLPSQSSPHAIC